MLCKFVQNSLNNTFKMSLWEDSLVFVPVGKDKVTYFPASSEFFHKDRIFLDGVGNTVLECGWSTKVTASILV